MTDNEVTSAEAFPLYWPDGWPRSTARARSPYKVGFHKARVELERGLNIMNTGGVVLSSNVPLRVDGLPYAGTAEKHYADPGVAIYFTWKGEPWVIACDCWDRVKDNLRAIGLTVDAMRMIERSGATELLKRAFAGFKALPAKGETTTDSVSWRGVLGLHHAANSLMDARARYRELSRRHHPDHGGDRAAMATINRAWAQAQGELK